MSVAALTMDDQRPLMNNFETMKKQYDHITNAGSGVGVGAAVSAAAGGGVVHNVGISTGGGVVGGVAFAAPASGPASPTPSTCEEQQQQHAHHHHHHHHHHAASLQHNHHTQHHQQHQLQQPTTAAATTTTTAALQQQQLPYDANAAAAAVAVAEQRQRLLEEEIESLKVEQTRLSQQCADAQRREKILMRRLANKEQEFQDYGTQIAEYKAAQAPTAAALRSALLDPAVNLLFEKLKKELKATKAKLEETQNELSAWKFTPDSNTGKRLMAKCRLLYQENEELGKMTSNGRLAKLETELAMQKSFSEEVKKSQSEFDDLVQELDEDVEGMQSTILFLQQELKTTRDRIQLLEKENYQLKTGNSSEQTDVTNSSCCNEQQIPSVNGNNGLIVDTTANIINNIINSQTQPAANLNIAQKPHKFQALDTIDEINCLRTTTNTNEFYNGLAVDQPAFAATAVIAVAGGVVHDEGSNSNGSNGSNNKLRSAGSRKRNYDSDQDQNASAIVTTAAAAAVPAPVQHIVTPRTLPPKKSKLRLTPARRASIQASEIMLDSDNALPMCGTPNLQAEPACNPFVVDNAVVGMANEEGANLSMAIDEDNNAAGGVAQRIMTRRRSVRNAQQNGDSNH